MVLSRFSRVMVGTKSYLDLLIELSSILDTKDFYILIYHQGLDYRIKGIYDLALNKLRYPKKFRKLIFDAEPEAILESEGIYDAMSASREGEYGRSIPVNMVMRERDGCLLYRVKISNSHVPHVIITNAYETVKKINNLDIDFTYTDSEIRCGNNYLLQAPVFNTNRIEAWIYKTGDYVRSEAP